MQICSVSKSLILSDFASLKTLYHEMSDGNSESLNFNFFPESKTFVETSTKMPCVNFYNVSSKPDKTFKLSLVRQINCTNPKLVCAACPKIVNDELALGYVNGQIKVINYTTNDTIHKFAAGMFL